MRWRKVSGQSRKDSGESGTLAETDGDKSVCGPE